MKKRLTEISVKRQSPNPNRRIEISDEVCAGLVLRITKNGKKSWSVVYRIADQGIDGKRGKLQRYTLGAYPLIDLKAAREQCRELKDLADQGIDPAAERKDASQRRQLRIFEAVLENFIEQHANPNTTKGGDIKHLLEQTFDYGWQKMDIAEIGRPDVHKLLDQITEDKSVAYAREMRAKLSKMFNWSVDRGLIVANPMAGLQRPELNHVARDRVLDMSELKAIWGAADQVGYPFGPIVKLLILTGQRRSEIAEMRRAWISSDGTYFEVPASSYKSKVIHLVPLPETAQTILEQQPIWNHGDFVFSMSGGKKPSSGFSQVKIRLDKLSGVTKWTFHDLRRSLATHLARLGVSQEHIERVHGHTIAGVAGTYNHYNYQKEKLAALTVWENELRSHLEINSVSRVLLSK